MSFFNVNIKIIIFLLFFQIISSFDSFSFDLDQLTNEEKALIINTVRNSQVEKNRVLKNVKTDHIAGKPQNCAKSYFFDDSNILDLLENVCENYDGNSVVNSNKKTMTLVKQFTNNVGMAVYKNPNGIDAPAPNNASPAGTSSNQTKLQQVDPTPMIEVSSNRVILVIGLKNLQQQPIFNPSLATMMTFYPQIP